MSNIFLIDNMDSFTYNLVDQLRHNNHKVIVYRNNIPIFLIIKKILKTKKSILIISPGPGKPADAGCVPKLLKKLIGVIPIIGICLGHQAIIEAYGGEIIQSTNIVHGKHSMIYHDNKYMFLNLPNPISVGRYHSLIAQNVPCTLKINAHYNKIIMAVRNNKDKVCGFQFHPESILTTQGEKILNQTIAWASS